MASQTGTDAATEARVLGNTLYKAGKLSQAEEAYKTAASLVPHHSSPVSNMSAVRYEMGDYRGAIAYINQVLALISDDTSDSGKKDKLYSRLAKCYLHLLEFIPAEDAISSIDSVDLRFELYESVESMKVLRAEAPDESALRRQVLDQISRFKPCLQDVAEYYAVGHDHTETLTEPFGKTGGTEIPDISFFFAGSGDGRNLFSAITSMFFREA
ncbi:hypothetical protein VHEMI04076 [[Torrubiella] hemipterigena]|uniref:Uncharacterized protein n=1 Tax=[Torrubiella] hemipterigena TaxID=1531966 RepID=A0A0A1TD55_9HYPO|nr:hypothetical protein VHEMI04076 [[Torrubiella] hemipterigena]